MREEGKRMRSLQEEEEKKMRDPEKQEHKMKDDDSLISSFSIILSPGIKDGNSFDCSYKSYTGSLPA